MHRAQVAVLGHLELHSGPGPGKRLGSGDEGMLDGHGMGLWSAGLSCAPCSHVHTGTHNTQLTIHTCPGDMLTHAHTRAHLCTRVQTRVLTHTHMSTGRAHTCPCTRTLVHMGICTHRHRAGSYMSRQAHAHIHPCPPHVHTHAHLSIGHICTCTRVSTQTPAGTHAHMSVGHTQKAHRYTHVHAHTGTHTLPEMCA